MFEMGKTKIILLSLIDLVPRERKEGMVDKLYIKLSMQIKFSELEILLKVSVLTCQNVQCNMTVFTLMSLVIAKTNVIVVEEILKCIKIFLRRLQNLTRSDQV